jgi:glycosyltransferase involved in cell wall biosynthesis
MNSSENPPKPSPLVSVCIPVYNCETYIGEAIRSIFSQTFQDFEIVVVDNASTDRTAEVVEAFQDPRIRLIKNATNLGPCRNWNISMEEARGKYIKMVGADDVLYADCLEEQTRVFELEGGDRVALVCCRRDIVNAQGSVIIRSHGWPSKGTSIRMNGRESIRKMVRFGRNLLGEPVSVMFRRSHAMEINWFDCSIEETIAFCLDWDLWCRLLQKGDLFVNERTLAAFRVNGGSNTLKLADRLASDDYKFFLRLERLGMADLSKYDLLLGKLGAKRDSFLRQALYAFLRKTGFLPR